VIPVSPNKILVGCDDSPGSRDAQRFAALVARTFGCELILANAYRDDRAAALDLLAEAERHVPYGTRADMRAVKSGSPPHALHDLADAEGATMIVVGQRSNTKGQSAFVTGAHCPVAVAPRGFAHDADPGFRVIGVAFDGSSESFAAVEAACELGVASGATVRLIGVAQEPPKPTAGMTAAWAAADFDYRAAMLAELETVADNLPPELRAQVLLSDGDPARTLIQRAAPLSLLVMGSHGRGPVRRALLGSVSAAVLRDLPCPVLVVPRGAEQQHAAAA
jgi:nucleotide-binding universal stress UspA family protein